MTEKFKPDGRTIYVPAANSTWLRREIARGSGIVGTPVGDTGRVLIDYEGAIYGQVNMQAYEDRIYHAYDRHTWRGVGYPTVARMLVPAGSLVEVGRIRERQFGSDRTKLKLTITRQDLVDEWCAP